ncbi:MAG: SUF system NifU family Fe-S cluster assembly protein, partial [Deltaproteobacteria bacterium]|nr:SUF system NifU family Fe-S cluster assembly protein [Deltaproteobacteria bacterium]
MNDDLRELYQDVIIEHSKRPRNFRSVEHAHHVDGYNPLCGDTVTVYVDLADDRVADCAFQGHGCAISTASASVMTETLKGKTRAEAEQLFQEFHDLVTGKSDGADVDQLGKLAVFAGVSEFPARVKCATLCWHTARAALEGKEEPVST